MIKEMFYPAAPHARRPVPRRAEATRTSGTRSPRRTLPTGTSTTRSGAGYTPAERAQPRSLDGLADRRNVIANNTGAGQAGAGVAERPQPNVVINEIQYNPTGGDNGEFIELTNPSATESVDLSGWTIDGIGLTIQPGTVLLPGAHVVFVKNDVAFRATYGPPTRFVGGEYSGRPRRRGRDAHAAPGHPGRRRGHVLADRAVADRGQRRRPVARARLPRRPTTACRGNWTANPLITGHARAREHRRRRSPTPSNPTTAITAPTEGASVFGPTTVTATAGDNIGVTSVA